MVITMAADTPSSWGRNVRAALVLRGETIETLAREMNKSEKTVRRTLEGSRRPNDWEKHRVAEVLSVPEWFLEHGLESPALALTRPALQERLDQVDRLVRLIEVERAWLAEAVTGGSGGSGDA